MNKTLKYILLSVLAFVSLVAIAIISSISLKSADKQLYTDINDNIKDISDKQLINRDEIIQFLNSNNINPIGKSSHQVSTATIEQALSKHPMIKRVDCYKTPRGIINIEIEQRTPLIRVMTGEDYYVDDLGKTMPISINSAIYVPIATGKITKTIATNELYNFVNYINKNEFWRNQIEQIHINNQNKVQLVPRVGEHIIVLGNFENFEKKLNRLKMFYLNGLNIAGWEAYSSIDLSFDNQVVCTRRI